MTTTDKRERAGLFRERLNAAFVALGTNQSALARTVGVDRSTISQLLAGRTTRLPNAQVVAECARALGVSADWLLGLSDRRERPGDLLDAYFRTTQAARSSADQQIIAWHKEAMGYKIRHVPATLPDMLKTREMLRWEYDLQLGRTTDQAIGAVEDQLDWFENNTSDYELAMPLHELSAFVSGEGYYRDLPARVRRDQIEQILALYDRHFPSMRIFLFDARQVFSAPVTVYGPLHAVIYLGQHYFAFRETERVHSITQHFNWLVRKAVVDARQFPQHLRDLAAEGSG